MIKKTILIVDDKADVRLSLQFLLTNHGHHVVEANSIKQATALMQQQKLDLVLLDMNYQLDTTSGEEGLAFIQAMQGQTSTPIIAMTAWSSVTLAVKAMQYGATDFFAKPWDNQAVLAMVHNHLTLAELNNTNQGAEASTDSRQLQWHGEAMLKLQKQIDRVAKTDATILLRGENGTGKTSIAHYVHQQSGVDGPFVSVNMAAIPEALFESELFGHKKGAFTDAKAHRIGRFEAAAFGTLFLDEVGCLGAEQQAKLLRVLESREFERIGDNQTRTANCRIICASNADFDQLLEQGLFRSDLYFRINTIELEVPPLRQRKLDILPLVYYFAHYHSEKYQLPVPQFSPSAEAALQAYHWPGNVRELSHLIARAVLMNEGDVVLESEFAFKVNRTKESDDLSLMTLEEAERKLLKMAMTQSQNNVEEAALLLGISKSAIYRRLEKFEMKTR